MTSLVVSATNVLSFLSLLGGLLAVLLFCILVTPLKKSGWGKTIAEFFGKNSLLLSSLIALGAAASSLFYSEIAGFLPCVLCWWQRIFLYPQAIILPIASFKKNYSLKTYSLALSAAGFLVALYHTYIQFGGEPVAPCVSTGASCQVLYFLQYGYVTIPTMSLTAFALMILFMLLPTGEVD